MDDMNKHAHEGIDPPHAGDKFRCDKCGMELQLTTDCGCSGKDHVHFECCGQELSKVE